MRLLASSLPGLALLFSLLAEAPTDARAQDAGAQDTSAITTAQPGVMLTIGGTLQPRFTHGRLDPETGVHTRERFGFGVRRARLRVDAQLTERVGAHLEFGAASAATQLFDAILFYDVSDAWRVRVGRYTSAQPRSMQGTSHTRVDLVDRAAIAQRWNNTTLDNDGRDFGLDALYETERFDLQAGVYNGIGDWSQAFGNLRTDIAEDPTRGTDTPGLAASFYGAWRPAVLTGIEVGGFAGYNAARSPVTRVEEASLPDGLPGPVRDRGRAYASYSGHLYWGARPGSQPVRLKADLIGTRFETLDFGDAARQPGGPRGLAQHALGAAFTGALGFFEQSAEALVRIERYDPFIERDDDAEDYLAAGASLSLSALRGQAYRRQRLTVAYSACVSDEDEPRLLVVQAQLVF